MPSRRLFALFATASLLSASAPAWSQPYGAKPGSVTENRTISAKDRRMAVAAAESGLAEVKLGELALRKASQTEVREFGQQMIKDHTLANKELKAWARSVNLALPTALNPQHQAEYNRLSRLSGEAFDKAYMQAMDRDHKLAFNLFDKGSKDADHPDLKNFFAKHLPTIQLHLQHAQHTRKSL